ncbi:MAG: tripartite tricarboxylate transporter substrate binding protein [Betaproteobacteria bacterium]|nr:tripartite tricarboxylate transporter substrate binding protein [Betaproteobacteria bacterium]
MASMFLRVLIVCAAATISLPALAQAYPAKPVRLVVPYAPGGPGDMVARLVGPKLSDALGQPVIVETRPGGGTSIGTAAVARSAPDGYTILIGTISSHATNPAINPNVPYDPVKDFAAVAPIVSYPFVLAVHSGIPARTVSDLVALAKAKPGKLAYGSAGPGTINHFAGELFKIQAGVNMLHVPYKGNAPAFADLVAGQVQVMFELTMNALAQAKAGRVRALGIASAQRSPLDPDLPTVEETHPGFQVATWMGAFAPAQTPAAIVERLNQEFGRIVAIQDIRERLIAQGGIPLASNSQEFTSFVAAEFAKWSRIAKEARISAN